MTKADPSWKPVRGRIVWLTREFMEVSFPLANTERGPDLKYGRPFLVVQNDLLNSTSDRTMVVPFTTVAAEATSSYSVLVPGKYSPGNKQMWASCGEMFQIKIADIDSFFDRVLPLSEMQKVDMALRKLLDLDPDRCYPSRFQGREL